MGENSRKRGKGIPLTFVDVATGTTTAVDEAGAAVVTAAAEEAAAEEIAARIKKRESGIVEGRSGRYEIVLTR